jgi:SAM-dependent methyltransferase
MKIVKSLTNCYNKLSNFGKILLFLILLLVVVVFFRSLMPNKEAFTEQSNFEFKQGESSYDDFYADIYDHLVYNQHKNNYEIGSIIKSSSPDEKSVVVDIGCGTGHHVHSLSSRNINVVGVDTSSAMIKKAKNNYPDIYNKFKIGDGLNSHLFQDNSLTHILCLYFTIYFMDNKMQFFNNCMNWLMPGGYLIVHLVDRYKFDPILPPGNPLYIVSPQKYAKERITKTKVTFNDFMYNANFKLDESNNMAIFDEKFKFNDGRVRKQEQRLYMEDLPTIVNMAQDAGFVVHAKIDLVKCAYEYQYLYVFVKP